MANQALIANPGGGAPDRTLRKIATMPLLSCFANLIAPEG